MFLQKLKKGKLQTICRNESETRSSFLKMKALKKAELAKLRYGKDMTTNDIARLKLIESKNKENSADSFRSIVNYRFMKTDSIKNPAPLTPKWCDPILTDDKIKINNQRNITVNYRCPKLKVYLEKFLDVISDRLKWKKKFVFKYIVSKVTADSIELRSELPVEEFGPYIKILENPTLPLWEMMCEKIHKDTGHVIGDITVNIHLIKE